MKSLLLCIVLMLCMGRLTAQTTESPKPGIKLIFEKTYLHTDRDVYAPGDTLWFKAYLVNAQDNKPINSSGNLYVDLISTEAKIIGTELIRLDNGLGNGDFELVDSLPAGKYRLRAYTNWMRNFGDNFIYEKTITILNVGALATTTTNVKANGKPAINIAAPTTPPALTKSWNVSFYPEGGFLVEGISSLVAVKAEDSFGKGILLSGAVLSATGDTVSRFSCDSLGMGLFALLPIKGQVYHAESGLNGKRSTFSLPEALKNGMTLQLKQTDADTLIHAVISNSIDPATLAAKPICTIAVKHGGVTLLSQQLQPSARQISVGISTTALTEGISAITLYDENHKPQCERLVYIHHTGSNPVIISADKKAYQPKERVSLQISAPPGSNLSMAVVDAGIVPQQADDIVSYLMLGSEIKGHVEHASRYFDSTNINRFKQLDLLLMTQGWRDFVWRRLADTAIRISYGAEQGVKIKGRVRDEVKNKMMPGLNLSLYASAAKGNKIFSGTTDSLGLFNFGGLMLYGLQNIKLASMSNKGEKRGMITIDTLIALPVKRQPTFIMANDSVIATALEKRETKIKTSVTNGVTRLREVKIKGRTGMLLRGGGAMMNWGKDQVFNITPADYKYKTLEWFLMQNTKGATMPVTDPDRSHGPPDEVMRALTGVAYPGVDTFKVYKQYHFGAGPDYFYREKTKALPPILFVNGRELYMEEYDQAEAYRTIYFPMPIHKFKSIVLKRVTGNLHGYGIEPEAERIAVDRFLLYLTMDENTMTNNPGSLSTDITGYYQARNFYQPPPGAKASIADFRSTIHWEPYIKTDATGKATVSFYNGGVTTPVNVIVQGITPQGAPVNSIISYSVK